MLQALSSLIYTGHNKPEIQLHHDVQKGIVGYSALLHDTYGGCWTGFIGERLIDGDISPCLMIAANQADSLRRWL